MVSIVCPCNNIDILNKILKLSLEKQINQDYELIIVDSKEKGFDSAADALNYGASLAKGKYLVFAHQDISFIENDAIDKIIYYLDNYECGFAGVAGPSDKNNYIVSSSVFHGSNHIQVGVKIKDVTEAYSVDECLMFCLKDKFKKFIKYGNTWHLYGVEYSNRCIIEKEKVFLFPIEIYHLSPGTSMNKMYYITLKKYAKKNKNVKIIRTCFGYFKNNCFISFVCNYRIFKMFIKKYIFRRK